MADNEWHYLQNQFLNATENSYKKANILDSDHLSKLAAENSDADIAALETRTQPLSADFKDKYTSWISAKAFWKGWTDAMDNLLDELSSQKIKEWDIQIQGEHLEGTPDYTILLPDRRGPFQRLGRDDTIAEVQALSQRLGDYPALVDTKTDVDAFLADLQNTRDQQQQKEEQVSMTSDQVEQARIALMTMMFGNLGALMDKYRETPNVIENFWQLDLIRDTGEDEDIPDPEPQPPIVLEIAPSSTENAINGGFTAETEFQFTNTGSVPLLICRVDAEGDTCPADGGLPPGETVIVSAGEMADGGDFINITNQDPTETGNIEIIVLE